MNYLREYWVLALVLAVCIVVILFYITEWAKGYNEANGFHPLKGIAGWGYIIAASAIIEPFRHLYNPIVHWYNLIEAGVITSIPALWALSVSIISFIIIFDILAPLALIGLFSYVAYLFFKKEKLFLSFSIFVTWFYVILWAVQIISKSLIFPQFHIFDAPHVNSFIGALIGTIIWVKYLRKSERMKINFVN